MTVAVAESAIPNLPARLSRDPVVLMEELAADGRLTGGRAHVLGLDAIRDALGRRWGERSGTVFEMVLSHARRLFEPEDIIERVGEVDVLIVSPANDPVVSRGLAARLMAEVLTHFLGEARPSALTIKTVTGFNNGQLSARALGAQELAEARLAADSARGMLAEMMPVDGASAALVGLPITTFDGRRLHLSFAVEPVIDLKRQATAGRLICPELTYAETGEPVNAAERMALLAADMERVDLATMDQGLAHLEASRARGEPAALILAVSFLTASSQRARTKLLARSGSLRGAVQGSVIWLLTDLPDGAPTSRLIEVTSLLKPFARAVFAETRINSTALKTARAAGIAGLKLQPNADLSDTDTALWLLQAGKLAERAAPALIAADLPHADILPMAEAAGFTHAILRRGQALNA